MSVLSEKILQFILSSLFQLAEKEETFSLQSMRAMNSITYSCNVLAAEKKLLINLKHNNIICNKNKSYLNTLSRNLRSLYTKVRAQRPQ